MIDKMGMEGLRQTVRPKRIRLDRSSTLRMSNASELLPVGIVGCIWGARAPR